MGSNVEAVQAEHPFGSASSLRPDCARGEGQSQGRGGVSVRSRSGSGSGLGQRGGVDCAPGQRRQQLKQDGHERRVRLLAPLLCG